MNEQPSFSWDLDGPPISPLLEEQKRQCEDRVQAALDTYPSGTFRQLSPAAQAHEGQTLLGATIKLRQLGNGILGIWDQ